MSWRHYAVQLACAGPDLSGLALAALVVVIVLAALF
jgi:hypothetical protein